MLAAQQPNSGTRTIWMLYTAAAWIALWNSHTFCNATMCCCTTQEKSDIHILCVLFPIFAITADTSASPIWTWTFIYFVSFPFPVTLIRCNNLPYLKTQICIQVFTAKQKKTCFHNTYSYILGVYCYELNKEKDALAADLLRKRLA